LALCLKPESMSKFSVIVASLLWLSGSAQDDNTSWDGESLRLGHTWDCNGMACDADTLKPWDEYQYITAPGYAPQDPAEHGGAVYGERMWLVGRASNAISEVFAQGSEEETCCGSHITGGCGQCLLIQNSDAVEKDWTAVVMKKSICPPWTPGCEPPMKSFELAVPGYETEGREGSTNVCSARSGTLFTSQAQSNLLGYWNRSFQNTADPGNMAQCDKLPEEFVSGCKLFSRWGWRTSSPQNIKYKKVKCPERFKQWVSEKITADGVNITGWYGQDLHLTHFWDCNGMGCDATVMRPFDKWRYIASPAYSPQDPKLHGGAEYGEKMWLVGAASDTLARIFGEADPCCGLDYSSPGCGRCLLIQNPDAVESNWSAVVMKKSRCPPESLGCEEGNVHLDLAVPGFDLISESTANVCNERENTLFYAKEQSGVLGDWYTRGTHTAEPQIMERCEWLDAALRPGCKLFASWGWKVGAPKNVKFKRVECPARFVQWVQGAFNETGVSNLRGFPTTTTTTTTTSTTYTTTTTTYTTTTTSMRTSSSTTTTTAARPNGVFMEPVDPQSDRVSTTTTSLMKTSSSTTTTTIAAITDSLEEEHSYTADAGKTAIIVASCVGALCLISCVIASCCSKCQG